MPSFVADFCHGEHSGGGGCPVVMISNAQARGVLVFIRTADELARQLVKELDAKVVEGKHIKGFVIQTTGEKDALVKFCQQAGLKHCTAGIPRQHSLETLNSLGLPAEVSHVVLFLDRDEVKASYVLSRGELTADKQKEIVAALAALAK